MKKIYLIIFLLILLPLMCFLVHNTKAAETPFPTATLEMAPENMNQPGQEVTLRASTENFSMEGQDKENTFYAWNLDGVPLNTLIAGSADEIKWDPAAAAWFLEGKFGSIKGPFGGTYNFGQNQRTGCREIRVISPPDEIPLTPPDNGCIKLPYAPAMCGSKAKNVPSDSIVKRIPVNDTDGDGMDDDWEIKYFSGRIRPPVTATAEGTGVITEEPYYYPTEKAAILAAVNPGDDSDHDGYKYVAGMSESDGSAEGSTNPGWAGPLGFGACGKSWMIGVPNASIGETGDEKFTNYEEYTFGTDPLNADTDDDGVKDEADVLGNMQDDFPLRINKDWGEKYKVGFQASGITQRYRDGGEDISALDSFHLVRFPKDEEQEKNEAEIAIGAGLPLKVGFGYKPSPPLAGDSNPVEVVAETSKLGEFEGLDLLYKWYLDAKPQDSPDLDSSGYGKKTFKFVPTKAPCDKHVVGLEIREDKTGRMNFQELSIIMGFNIKSELKLIGNADLTNKDAKNLNLREGSNVGNGAVNNPESLNFLLPNDLLKDKIDPAKGFRKGDVVQISISGLKEGYEGSESNGPERCGGNNYEDYLSNLDFKWFFKRRSLMTQSGKGEPFQKAVFVLKGEGRSSEDSTGGDAGNLSETGSEFANLEVVNEVGEAVARIKEEFRIIQPSVDFEISGVETGTSQENTNVPTYSAKPGDEIKVTARLNYFRPSKGIDYTWQKNKETVSEAQGTNTIESTYTFKAGMDINGKLTNVNEENIALDVKSEVNNQTESGGKEIESSNKGIIIKLINPNTSGTGSNISGAIQKFIPNYYKNVFNLFLAVGFLGIIAFIVLGFMKGVEGRGNKE